MGRPRKQIDPEQVSRLAACGCTVNEMAAVLDCNRRTLERRFYPAIQKGRERGRGSLRHRQYQLAMKGDKTMLVWLGKQMLGQTDRLVLLKREEFLAVMQQMVKVVSEHVHDEETREKIRLGILAIGERFRDVDGFA